MKLSRQADTASAMLAPKTEDGKPAETPKMASADSAVDSLKGAAETALASGDSPREMAAGAVAAAESALASTTDGDGEFACPGSGGQEKGRYRIDIDIVSGSGNRGCRADGIRARLAQVRSAVDHSLQHWRTGRHGGQRRIDSTRGTFGTEGRSGELFRSEGGNEDQAEKERRLLHPDDQEGLVG